MAEGGAGRQHVVLCQICDVTKADLFCKECIQSMCNSCKKRHDNVRNFDKHPIAPLCEKHRQPLTHLCHTCIAGMCIKCVLNDHVDHDHGKGFDTFSEGVDNLRKKLANLLERVTENESKIKTELSYAEAKLEDTKEIKTLLKNLRTVYVDKISKVDNLLNDLEEKYEAKGENITQGFKEILVKSEVLKSTLNFDGKSDQKVVTGYEMSDTQAQELLQTSIALMSERFLGVELEQISDDYSTCLQEAGVYSYFQTEDITTKTPKEILHFEGQGNNELKYPSDIVNVSADSVIVCDGSAKQCFFVNKDGVLIRTFVPENTVVGYFMTAAIQDDDCFIAQRNSITKVSLQNSKEKSCVVPGISDIVGFSCASKDKFICLSNSDKSVFEFSLAENSKRKVLQADTYLWFISKRNTGNWLVTSPNEHCVREYNEQWDLVRKIGSRGNKDGQLQNPWGNTTTPSGHILVADWGNNRLTCFNPDGSFNKHILTEKDGIKKPYAVAFRYPFLWVTQSFPACLKCFELC